MSVGKLTIRLTLEVRRVTKILSFQIGILGVGACKLMIRACGSRGFILNRIETMQIWSRPIAQIHSSYATRGASVDCLVLGFRVDGYREFDQRLRAF